MQNVKILIVEDELIIAKDLKETLLEMNYEVVGIASSLEEAKEKLLKYKPDIALLDIFLTRQNEGIEVAYFIRQNFEMPFIFLTSYSDSRTLNEAKNLQPNAYLVKPFQVDSLYTAIEIAIFNFAQQIKKAPQPPKEEQMVEIDDDDNQEEHEKGDTNLILDNMIFVKNGDFFIKIPVNDIMFFQSEKNYVELFAEKSKYLIRHSLSDLHNHLNNDVFYRIHKSYIVNIAFIKAIKSNQIMMKNGNLIPVGRVYKNVVMEILQKNRF